MKTLVEMAQELGIQPKDDLTAADWQQITRLIGGRLLQETTGLPPEDRHEKSRRRSPDDLAEHLYNLRKHVNRHLDEGVSERVARVLKKGREKIDKIFIHSSVIGLQTLEETPYIFHSSLNQTADTRERFAVDIDPASPHLAKMIGNLDQFIQKYHAKFKVPNAGNLNRTDTLNIYVSDEITPEMTQELVKIVQPCLSGRYHDKLDGVEIFAGNKPIRGIKIGPEMDTGSSEEEGKQKYAMRSEKAAGLLNQDIKDDGLNQIAQRYVEPLLKDSSLGEKSAALQVMDLLYYAMGKKSPFRLMSYDEEPYDKEIVLPAEVLEQQHEGSGKKLSLFARFFSRASAEKKPEKKSEEKPKNYWDDSHLWHEVLVQAKDGVIFGHRIRLADLTIDQQQEMEKRLTEMNIQYEKRQATKPGSGIQAGDWTLRVSKPDSIRQLRRMVFQWAEGGRARPVFMSSAEYAEHQKQLNALKQNSH